MAATEIIAGARLGTDGRYRLRTTLGHGGMSQVWLADDERLRRPVAIKILAESLAADPAYVERLEREARLAAGLSHPHLVRVFDFSPGPPKPFLVMEYVPGGTLSDALATELPRDPEALLRDLLGALAHVHAAGIVHRDVKPANVLMDPVNGPRLTDFGIARPSEATALTSTGLVIGTRRYIAPEVLAGGRADARSDLFSLGVLLQECLGPSAPRHLRRLAATLTAEDPAGRPASAAAALAALERRPATERLRAHAPVIERRDGQVRIRLTRTGAAALAAAVVLVLAIIVLAASGGGGTGQGGGSRSAGPFVPPASAPLGTQLDAIGRDISSARR